MERVIKNSNLAYLVKFDLVDIYENEQKLPGKKSVTLRFTIGSKDKTLSKDEIDLHMNTLIENFAKEGMNINY